MTGITIRIDADSDGSFNVFARWRGHPAGHAFCIRTCTRLKICDIKVHGPYRRPWWGLGWIGFPFTTVICRQRGVGTAILQCVVAKATEDGVIEVWGEVVDHDLASTISLRMVRTSRIYDLHRRRMYRQQRRQEDCEKAMPIRLTRNNNACPQLIHQDRLNLSAQRRHLAPIPVAAPWFPRFAVVAGRRLVTLQM